MNNKKVKVEKGFNLSELLVVISILGVIAAIMIPAGINNSKKTQHQVQLQKAMANYDSALRLMQVDKMAKNMDVINNNLGQNCSNIKKYFRVITDDGCTFMSNDKIWYQFQSQGNSPSASMVAVAFERKNLGKAVEDEDTSAFMFVADINNGQLQINNPGYKNANAIYKFSVEKTFNFINKKH